jgi:hypothetical protein
VKVEVRDSTVLRSLRPLEVAAYLRSRGWEARQLVGERASVWGRAQDEDVELLLPADRDLADFAARMADVLRALAAVEDRSQLEILRDLAQSAHDVIRVRAAVDVPGDFTIALEAGTDLLDHARDMLLAAASATAERRAYFPTRKPSAAVDYMGRVRLGQTEPGSYVLTLLSPVSPTLRGGPQPDLGLEDPFERRVTLTLARSLSALHAAASDAAATGMFAGFDRAVEQGVTANLCEAVAGMAEGLGSTADLGIAISWSPTRPVDLGPTHVRFGSDIAPVVREAARIIRAAAPIDDYQVVGIVIRLEQRPNAAPDRAWVLTITEGSPRSVGMTLRPEDRDAAIVAYRDRLPVSAVGRLTRSGPLFTLEEARDFRVVDLEASPLR